MVDIEKEMLESTYDGLCTITHLEKIKVESETVLRERIVCENVPCALSRLSQSYGNQQEVYTEATASFKLFLSPSINVQEGSLVTVHQYDKVYALIASGVPMVYPSHQEVVLLYKVKA